MPMPGFTPCASSCGGLLLWPLLLLLSYPARVSSTLYLIAPYPNAYPRADNQVQPGVLAYPSEPASFGYAFGGDISGKGNLFLPPVGVDPRLCDDVDDDDGERNLDGVYPREENGAGTFDEFVSSSEVAGGGGGGGGNYWAEWTPSLPIALLAERGGCTFEQKARNAVRLNAKLVREAILISRDSMRDGGEGYGGTGGGSASGAYEAGSEPSNPAAFELPTLRIDYLVLYNDRNSADGVSDPGQGQADELVSMSRPSGPYDVEHMEPITMGLVMVSRKSGIDIQAKMQDRFRLRYDVYGDYYSVESKPYQLSAYDFFASAVPVRGGWTMPIVVDSTSALADRNNDSDKTSTGAGGHTDEGVMRLRFTLCVVFSFLIVGFAVWFCVGGRMKWKRDATSGRIVGIQFVRHETHIFDIFGGWDAWDVVEGGQGQGETVEKEVVVHRMTKEEVMDLPEIAYSWRRSTIHEPLESGPSSDAVASASVGTIRRLSEARRISERNLVQLGQDAQDAQDKQDKLTAVISRALSNQSLAIFAQDAQQEATPTTSPHEAFKSSTCCTSCSICIDDFTPGEKIRLLPRCGHAFHTECILPWVTQKRGSCPLCKQNVMSSGTDGVDDSDDDEEEEEESAAGLNIDSDADEEAGLAIDEEDVMRDEEAANDEEQGVSQSRTT